MDTGMIILLGLALVAFKFRRPSILGQLKWGRHLSGRQKLIGVIALVLAMGVLLAPELLALGIVGDAAFLDVLVLAFSFQIHAFLVRVAGLLVRTLAFCRLWLGFPSPHTACMFAYVVAAVGCGAASSQKLVQRLLV